MVEQNVVENILITGSAGFVGSHLIDYLLTLPGSYQIHGLIRYNTAHLAHLQDEPRLTLHRLELNDRETLVKLLKELKPGRIFHLAAQSAPALSIKNPAETLNNNLNSALSLFEAVREACLEQTVRILNVGSGDQYGFVTPEELPIRESTPFRPGNPYAVSKIAQEMLGYQYFRSYGLQIIATRTFNHVGPRQGENLATSAFARQVALAEIRRIDPVIKVGNLDARRDYTDVRDVVQAYWLALEGGTQPGEAYNLCSGESHRMADILEALLTLAQGSLAVEFDPTRSRPSDIPVICGDYSKFHRATGWRPTIPLEQSLQDLLNYWRGKVREL